MFVVAADSGWMPQSTEHLYALDALGVRALPVVTRSDLADPELARDEALGAPVRVVAGAAPGSVRVGSDGCGPREAALGVVAARRRVARPGPRRRRAPVGGPRVHGAGGGHSGHRDARGGHDPGWATSWPWARARSPCAGCRALGESVDPVRAVARVALNLRGVGLDEVGRGDALTTPGRWLRLRRRRRTRGTAWGRLGRGGAAEQARDLHLGSWRCARAAAWTGAHGRT